MGSMPRVAARSNSWVALLGRGRGDADGIRDYCRFLGKALEAHGIGLETYELDWTGIGWRQALAHLRKTCKGWKGRWVLLQFTALAFSNRGFPLRAISALRILKENGVRCAVVFHDPFRHGGKRLRDRVRGAAQDWVIQRLFRLADCGIFPDPLTKIYWLPKNAGRAFSIPIGANIPVVEFFSPPTASHGGADKTVAVYCLSLDAVREEELQDILIAARTTYREVGRFRLVFLGRGTEEVRSEIIERFKSVPVETIVLGILEPERITSTLQKADAMLCVRGKLYPRRGSAIAGLACGLPIVGYGGEAEGTPLTEAGILFVPYRDAAMMGCELARILADSTLASELRRRSVEAYRRYYSWDLIATAFQRHLEKLEA